MLKNNANGEFGFAVEVRFQANNSPRTNYIGLSLFVDKDAAEKWADETTEASVDDDNGVTSCHVRPAELTDVEFA